MKTWIPYFLLLASIFYTKEISAQTQTKSYDTVTNYIHIKLDSWSSGRQYEGKIIAFILTNKDTLGVDNWQSKKISEFEKDESGYFAKVDMPSFVLQNSDRLACQALIRNGDDTLRINYGGVELSKIKLILKSTPAGAESFLVPNRIWMGKIEKLNWKTNSSVIEKFRVNTSSTDTYAYVDETVFVVLYKIKNKFKKTIHFTKPASIENEQTVWMTFE